MRPLIEGDAARPVPLAPVRREGSRGEMVLEGHEPRHYQFVVGLLVGLHEVPVEAKFCRAPAAACGRPVDDGLLMARPAVEADGVLAEDRPPVATRAPDLHAAKQPQHRTAQAATARLPLRREYSEPAKGQLCRPSPVVAITQAAYLRPQEHREDGSRVPTRRSDAPSRQPRVPPRLLEAPNWVKRVATDQNTQSCLLPTRRRPCQPGLPRPICAPVSL